jgi:CubicO group peptidase (beta-lactamase class C family)
MFGCVAEVDWMECPPRQAGADAAALDRVVELVQARGAMVQLCVLRHGQVVLDRQFGCRADALFWVFSVSKPFVALLVHLLAERGELALDDPVAVYWPAYARHGKDAITIRHVLTHRAGVPIASRGLLGDVRAMTNWDRAVRQAESARPRWPAGQVPAYHTLTYGFILGELLRRVTGVPVPGLLAAEFCGPLRRRRRRPGRSAMTGREHDVGVGAGRDRHLRL